MRASTSELVAQRYNQERADSLAIYCPPVCSGSPLLGLPPLDHGTLDMDPHPSVGATLENTEKPRCTLDKDCHALIASLDPSERPLDLTGEHKDPKSRFFWRMDGQQGPGEPEDLPADIVDSGNSQQDAQARFAVLKAPNVIPKAFEAVWKDKMERWGGQMLQAVQDVNVMLAVGLGLPDDYLTNLAK